MITYFQINFDLLHAMTLSKEIFISMHFVHLIRTSLEHFLCTQILKCMQDVEKNIRFDSRDSNVLKLFLFSA